MKKEVWRMIPGYEGLYLVSNLGRVKSVERVSPQGHLLPERIMKQFKMPSGYLHVRLCKDGKVKNYRVHRLVAQAFIPNPEGLPQVNHINEDKMDNRVENLEWCDCKYNINHGTGIERRSKKRINEVGRSKPVLQYTHDGQFVREWPSTMECHRNEFDRRAVTACCRGKLKTYKGFTWRFK